MVNVQMLAELEEVIQFKLIEERRDTIKDMWWNRLRVCYEFCTLLSVCFTTSVILPDNLFCSISVACVSGVILDCVLSSSCDSTCNKTKNSFFCDHSHCLLHQLRKVTCLITGSEQAIAVKLKLVVKWCFKT
jgi:hypothetical protein